jgi:mannan endo-1,4-beta-mannosidase
VSYKTDVGATSEYIRPFLEIANIGQAPVPLAELEVRYFYTRDSTAMETVDCFFATPGCDRVTLAVASIDPPLPLADRVLSVSFEVGAPVLAANDLARVDVAVHKVDFDVYDQSGDYSFDASKTAYEVHAKVCLYRDGELIWGTEPGP